MAYPNTAHELGTWIAETWVWQLFFTVTLKDHETGYRAGTPVGVRKAELLLDRWLKGSVATRGPAPYWWAAMESHRWRSTPHFHGLIGGLDPGTLRSAMWADWRASDELAGRAQIVPVRDEVGAAVYVAKYINKGLGKIYTSDSLGLFKRRRDEAEESAIDFAAASAGAGRDVQCAPDPLQTDTAPRRST